MAGQRKKLENANTEEEEKKPPSLRRHYPVQVLRVLSQPIIRPPSGGGCSAPRELLKTGFPPAIQRYVTGNFYLRHNKK